MSPNGWRRRPDRVMNWLPKAIGYAVAGLIVLGLVLLIVRNLT